jgi:hypothetical protein
MRPRLPGAVPGVAKSPNVIGPVLAGMGKHEEALVECQQADATHTLSSQPSALFQQAGATHTLSSQPSALFQQADATHTLSSQPSALSQSKNAGAARGGLGSIIMYIFLLQKVS